MTPTSKTRLAAQNAIQSRSHASLLSTPSRQTHMHFTLFVLVLVNKTDEILAENYHLHDYAFVFHIPTIKQRL